MFWRTHTKSLEKVEVARPNRPLSVEAAAMNKVETQERRLALDFSHLKPYTQPRFQKGSLCCGQNKL